MIARARERGLYARLEQADLIEFLAREPDDSCDLVFAADVFCYLGGLDAIFAAVPRIMRTNALLVFSVESLEKASLAVEAQRTQSHSVTVSGRFAHSRPYIEDLASASRLTVVNCTQATLRAEHDGQIVGWLFALCKP